MTITKAIEPKFSSLEELKHLINPDHPIMCDTETIGLYGKIRLVQFYQRNWVNSNGEPQPYLVENPNPFELAGLLNGLHVVFHNAHYDITTVQQQMGNIVWMPEQFDCTFLLGRLYFYKEESFTLDNIISYVLGYNPYTNKKEMQGSDWAVPVLSPEQIIYAASDVVYLHDVYDAVKEMQEDLSYVLDKYMLRYCLDFQNNGMPVDVDKLNAQYEKNMNRIREIGLTINCNSYKQVRAYINSEESDDLGLAKQSAQGNEKATHVRETRKLTKNNSFLTKFLNTMRDGIIYGKFKLSPRSGRTSSDDQNLQQLPRSLKGIFGVQEDGDEVMLFSDFAQIQLRGVCVVVGDRAMEALFRAGEDLHNFVAKMIFGENFTKEHRQISKTANFSLLFGAGIIMFISILLTTTGMWLSEDKAGSMKKSWRTLWKEISKWQDKGIEDWKSGKPWQTPLGRRYTAKMMTDQLAMQIQGFEAEVAKLATHYMWPRLKELNTLVPEGMPKFRIRNFIHDSYILTGANIPELYKQAAEIMASSMQEAWQQMCQSVVVTDLPMPTKVRVGWNWGELDKDEKDGGKWIYELVKQ